MAYRHVFNQRLWQAQTHVDGLYQQGHRPHMGYPYGLGFAYPLVNIQKAIRNDHL
jgi:hypothetical protein